MDSSETLTQQQMRHSTVVQNPNTVDSLSHWIFEQVKPYTMGRVLEIADGKGCIAPTSLEQGIKVEVMGIELWNEDFETNNQGLLEAFDAVIVMNKGENVARDRSLAGNWAKLLKRDGHLLIHVPACTALYCGLDQGYSNWRDCNQWFINKLFRNEYKIIKTKYFIIEKDPTVDITSATQYDKHVTIFSTANAAQFIQSGLSILIIGRKR